MAFQPSVHMMGYISSLTAVAGAALMAGVAVVDAQNDRPQAKAVVVARGVGLLSAACAAPAGHPASSMPTWNSASAHAGGRRRIKKALAAGTLQDATEIWTLFSLTLSGVPKFWRISSTLQ